MIQVCIISQVLFFSLQQGYTAAHIARRQHYLAIFDTLRTVTTVVTEWESVEEIEESEEIILDSPELVGEAAAVDSDEEASKTLFFLSKISWNR